MNRLLLCLAMSAILAACVDSGCPEGSEEVSGRCQTIDDDADAATREDAGSPDGGELRDGGAVDGDDAAAADAGADPADAEVVDPCSLISCGDNAHCVVQDDEAGCECDEGFEGDGTTCEVNPCADDPCDAETSTCKAGDGMAVCECLEGLSRCDDDPFACSTDVQTDAAHCGACGAACAGNLECEEGACEQRIVQLSLGLEHSCALEPDGDVLCWGSDDALQLQHVDSGPPDHEPGLTSIGKTRALSSNVATNCALLMGGDLVCWGSNDPFSWLAPGAQQGVFNLGAASNYEDVIVGNLAACLLIRGEAACWGLSSSFDPGGDSQYAFLDPTYITLPSDIVQLSTGYRTCAVSENGRVSCWGQTVATPTVIEDASGPLEDVQQVAVSWATGTSCAVLGNGRVMCWGQNDKGQLGNTSATASNVALAVPVTDDEGVPLSGFVQVGVSSTHGCGRTEAGTVMCWGQANRLGNAATGSAAQRYATEVKDVTDAIELAVGGSHSCVRRKNGQVQCWGDNNRGQLGVARQQIGGIASSAVPVNVAGLP
jgi:hypothetical protein